MRSALLTLGAPLPTLAPTLAQAADVDLAPLPAQPLIEVSAKQQILNFDVLLTNNTTEELEVSRYELTVLGPNATLDLHPLRYETTRS